MNTIFPSQRVPQSQKMEENSKKMEKMTFFSTSFFFLKIIKFDQLMPKTQWIMVRTEGISIKRANLKKIDVGKIEDLEYASISFAYLSLHAVLKNCTDPHGLK